MWTPFQNEHLFGGTGYFWLHGRTGYQYKYTEEDLKNLKKTCIANPLTHCVFDNASIDKDGSH